MTVSLTALAAANIWIAVNFARAPLAQDEALWLLWGMTGARPYRAHVDCKPPGIHVWFWLLARLCAGRLPLIKLTHHLAIGACAVGAATISGNIAVGIAFTALGQSAWLGAYHAQLEGLSTALLLLALVCGPWPATLLLALACATNLKLLVPAMLYLLLAGLCIQAAVLLGAGMLALAAGRLGAPELFGDLRYALLTVPRRMVARRVARRRAGFQLNSADAVPLLLVMPAIAAAVVARPEARLWLPMLAYVAVNAAGRVWRAYHWIPVAAFVAAAGSPYAIFVLAGEWLAAGFYLGDFVERTRPGVSRLMRSARAIGEWLEPIPGSLYVCDPRTQVYIYARKQPALGFVEQVEIRDVIDERRSDQRGRLRSVDLLVFGPGSIVVAPPGYARMAARNGFVVLVRLHAPGR